MSDRIESLTPRQRDCLRLVAKGYQTKEIAERLGISPGRVDKHVTAALRDLGVSGRVQAARLLADHETLQIAPQEGAQWLGAQPLGLPGEPSAPQHVPSEGSNGLEEEAPAASARAAIQPFRLSLPMGRLPLPFPFATKGRLRNDLSPLETVIAMLVVAAVGAAAAGATVSLLLVLDQLLVLFRHSSP